MRFRPAFGRSSLSICPNGTSSEENVPTATEDCWVPSRASIFLANRHGPRRYTTCTSFELTIEMGYKLTWPMLVLGQQFTTQFPFTCSRRTNTLARSEEAS